MKRVVLVGGVALLIVVVAVLVTLRIVGLDPRERRPGLWLTGTPVTAPVTDWSFTDRHPTIYVQTRAWYGLPHSVTVTCVAHDGRLYLTSVYREDARFPSDKAWTANVVRDPRVRLKIGDRVFDQTLALVTDPAEKAAALESKARKYPRQRATDAKNVYVFRVGPG
jgi:hypothetical protein